MDNTLTATMKDMTDSDAVADIRKEIRDHADYETRDSAPRSTANKPSSISGKALEMLAKRLGYQHLLKLAEHRGDFRQTFEQLPGRMHRAADQTQLIIELVEDFRTGAYRAIPWRSVSIAAAAMLYIASPIDLLPDVLVGLGSLDDLAVMALAARMLRKDLVAYCQFKGYDPDKYFGELAAAA